MVGDKKCYSINRGWKRNQCWQKITFENKKLWKLSEKVGGEEVLYSLTLGMFLFSFNQTNIHAPSAKCPAGKGQGVKQQSLSKSYPGGNRKNLNLDAAEC